VSAVAGSPTVIRPTLPRRATARIAPFAVEIGATALIIAALWYYTDHAGSYLVVPLPTMLSAFRKAWLFADFSSDVLPSLERITIGYWIAVVIGVAGGLILNRFRLVHLALDPAIHFMRSLPGPALLPVAIALLGLGSSMRISLIAFLCVWPILLNTLDGAAEVDATVIATAKVFGITGPRFLLQVMLPAISPRIAAGMRTSLSLAVLVLILTEEVGGGNGIGYFVITAEQGFEIPQVWAGILLLGLLGVVLNAGFGVIERMVLRWHFRSIERG
jgi:ABC-type nitrate/sulfonate/bicarbonate transport system permease component